MQDFRITQIAPDAYHILDAGEDSFYLVVGSQRAAVIDTGITPGGKILPIIRQLTDKPLVLALTHAHIDHFHHMDEFETVYMSHREFEMGQAVLHHMMAGKDLNLAGTLDIQTGDIIDLGNEQLEVCLVPGHTPGSAMFLAKQRNLLFTGDAIGSGYGVWMQTPGALPLTVYYGSLRALIRWLVDRGGGMRFFGGHNMQQFQSTWVPHYNPLNLGLLCDLADLVGKICSGEIVGRASNADKVFSLEPALYACYGRAEIQYLPSRIRE